MKEQARNTEVQINEEEIGRLPEKEFRIIIVKMIKNLESKITNPIISRRITTSLSLAHWRKNKQTKTQHKSHPI